MVELLHKSSKRMQCGIYGCRNLTQYAIGHPKFAHTHLDLCEEHAKQVIQEGMKLFGFDKVEPPAPPVETVVEPTAPTEEPKISRKELFALCKEHDIKKFTTLKTEVILEELRKKGVQVDG